MKALLCLSSFAFFSFMVSPAMAAYEGPNATTITEIIAVEDAADDCVCIFEGNIVEKVKNSKEHYVMKDPTGEVYVEIEDEVFGNKMVNPKTKVRTHGRLDKDKKAMGSNPDIVEVYFFEIVQ